MSQQHTLGKHATTVRGCATNSNPLSVVYQNTEVVNVTSDKITLNTGGWFTNTTKTRMNQTSNQFGLGFSVYQKNYRWFVEYAGKITQFTSDSVSIDR